MEFLAAFCVFYALSLLWALTLPVCAFPNSLGPAVSFSCLADFCSSFGFSVKPCFFRSAEPWHPGLGLDTFLWAPVQGLAQVLGFVSIWNQTPLNSLLLCVIIEPAKHQHKVKDSSKWIISPPRPPTQRSGGFCPPGGGGVKKEPRP